MGGDRRREKMQAKHSTTECRHDGIGIPSATRPFAVVNKKQTKQKDKPMKIIKTSHSRPWRLWRPRCCSKLQSREPMTTAKRAATTRRETGITQCRSHLHEMDHRDPGLPGLLETLEGVDHLLLLYLKRSVASHCHFGRICRDLGFRDLPARPPHVKLQWSLRPTDVPQQSYPETNSHVPA